MTALDEQRAAWDDVFVYFKHEEEGKGPEFARTFIDILKRRQSIEADKKSSTIDSAQ